MNGLLKTLALVAWLLPSMAGLTAWAGEIDPSETARSLDEEVQGLKQEVLELNRDLFLLEEELLFPSSTQLSVFVSVDIGSYFDLDSIEIKLDDKVVTNYLYTERERDALLRGGVHRIYTGNLKSGKHELVALVVGQGPRERDYRRGASIEFSKTLGPKYIELRILDDTHKQQPRFEFKEW
jgi:hypothetical protein